MMWYGLLKGKDTVISFQNTVHEGEFPYPSETISPPPLSGGGWAKIGDFGANMYNQAGGTLMNYLNNLLEPQNFKSTCQFYFLKMMLYTRVFQHFSTHGTRIVKAHHQFLRRDFIIIKTINKIVFKISITKILSIVLFLKIILIMDFDNFCIPHFCLTSFRPSPKLPWHTCIPFVSHQSAAAHS
jgi:hypothetical protein